MEGPHASWALMCPSFNANSTHSTKVGGPMQKLNRKYLYVLASESFFFVHSLCARENVTGETQKSNATKRRALPYSGAVQPPTTK